MTEEIHPGFKYSVFSYVVSLLRPEIIRELDLPRHGLEILPLESTVTPLPNGDYLGRWADHDQTRRELYRHSPKDAEAYDDYGKLMYHLAFAVKPIVGMVPPDPTSLSFKDLKSLLKLSKHFKSLGNEQFHALFKLMTMSSADFLDEWFESEILKAPMAVSGIIGGNAFDTLFVAASDIAYRDGSIYHVVSNQVLLWIAITIVMTGVMMLGLIRREEQNWGGIGFESAIILMLYALGGVLVMI